MQRVERADPVDCGCVERPGRAAHGTSVVESAQRGARAPVGGGVAVPCSSPPRRANCGAHPSPLLRFRVVRLQLYLESIAHVVLRHVVQIHPTS